MKKLFTDMSKFNNGVCPFCGKGPVEVTLRDVSRFIIDESGIPIISRTTKLSSFGRCLNCGKYIGEYVRDMFTYRRPARKPIVRDNIILTGTKKKNPFMK